MAERELREGDIVIGQGFVNDPEYNGQEGTVIIVVPLEMMRVALPGFDPEYRYAVVFQDGSKARVKRERLRLKRPKEDDKAWAMSKVKELLKENDLVTA